MTNPTCPSSNAPPPEYKPPLCVVNTEGVEFTFRWDKFPVGGNVFIPCLGTRDVVAQVKASAVEHGVQIRYRVGIRNEKWGVGIWRIV